MRDEKISKTRTMITGRLPFQPHHLFRGGGDAGAHAARLPPANGRRSHRNAITSAPRRGDMDSPRLHDGRATRRSQAPRSNRCGSRITTSGPSLPGNLPMRHSKEWKIDLGSQGHGELALVRTVRIHTRTRTSAQPAVEHFSGLHSDRDRSLLHRVTGRAGFLHAWRPSELRLLH